MRHCVHDDGYGDRGLAPLLAFKFQGKKMLVPRPLVNIKYCGEPLWPRDRVRPQTTGTRISSPVSGGQCHLIHLTIPKRFSRPNLAYKLCAQRWPITPFIHAFWVMNKQENVHGSWEFFHKMMSSLKLISNLMIYFVIVVSGTPEKTMPNHRTAIVSYSFMTKWSSHLLDRYFIWYWNWNVADICTENDMNENSDIDNSTDERTVDFKWVIRNQHNQLHCRFQITYNKLFHGIRNHFDCFNWTRSLWEEL